MTQRKKLIEVALPLEAINVASAREKSIRHGHPSTLHLWWARRPLAAARAVIFTSLVDDPDDSNAPPEFVDACRKLPKGKNATANDTPRQRLFDFIEQLVTWEATTDEKILNTARELILLATDGNPPPLLDPFAGGGSIPLEAQRLGLEAHASDLNPVAVMINKAMIEIPPKFANQPPVNPRDRAKVGGAGDWKGASGLAADVRYYGEWMREKAWERIGHLYPECNGKTVIAWLWARTVKCPNPACGAQMPLVRSFDLSKKKGKRAWVEPKVDPKTRQISFEVKQASKGSGPDGTVNRQGATCLACKTAVPFDHIRDEGKAGQMDAQLMAIVIEGNNDRDFHVPTSEHETIAHVAVPDNAPDTNLPEQALSFRVQLYGMTKHRHLFSPRQLTVLTTFSDLVVEARSQIRADAVAVGLSDDDVRLGENGKGGRAYADAISVYLAFCIDKLTTTNSLLCTWQNKPTRLVAAFSRQALPMVWDYAEANPFSEAAGDYRLAIDSLTRVLDNLLPISQGFARQRDARNLDPHKELMCSTDPPYYDNIGYADLSDYFYAWQRMALREAFPDVFSTLQVPKTAELIATPFRFDGSRELANEHFEDGLQITFKNIRGFASSLYPLSIYYAFKQSELIVSEDETSVSSTGWETMLEALLSSGFSISGTWPVRTELTAALKSKVNALASSIVLVCRPRPENAPLTSRREFVNNLRRELPAALRDMQSGNIAPVDLAQACIGPGMAVYSRYSQVLEADGSRLTVRAALQLINQVLDEFLAETEGDLDGDSRFAVSWFEQFGFNNGEFGVADVLARAKNTSVEGLVQAGVTEAGIGKVRLFTWEELEPGWNPAEDKRATVWEATHHLIERLNVHGEEGAAMLLAKMSSELAASSRQLAYRLYAICERKGWSDHARDYNALVISWSTSAERAAEVKQTYQQRSLFE